MPRVLIGPGTLMDVDGEYRQVLRDGGFELVFPPSTAQMSEEVLLERLTGCDATLAGSEPYTRRVIAAHPQLKVIARSGVGYDAVDCVAATEAGIPVTISPGNAEGVAEHTFGLILTLTKDIIGQQHAIVAGTWPRRSNRPLRGTTLAIVGLGRIGTQVALRAKAFGMTVIAYDPVPNTAFASMNGVALVSREEAFRRGDIVSLHLPLSSATRRSVDSVTLGLMKPTAFLINTSRGGVINEADLHSCLHANRIAGAGLDVFDPEPPLKDNPLLQLPNVVLTAHTAGVDVRARDDMALIAAKAIVELCNGGWPAELVVNPGVKRP